MILLIDNYDSFSYNLYQMIGACDPEIQVIRNDEMSVEQIRELRPEHIVLSPGPGRPEDAGILMEVVREIHEIPILGVCLGHQSIAEAFGGRVIPARQLMHGKTSRIKFEEKHPLLSLMDKEENGTGIQVSIGSELQNEEMKDCSVVTASYDLGDGMYGRIGIVGPKRMDYDKVVGILKDLTGQLDVVYRQGETGRQE